VRKLIIYGTGLVAEVAEFYFSADTDYQVSAFTNAGEFITETQFNRKPVIPFETLETTHSPDEYDIFIALGYINTNQVRQARYYQAKEKGYTCASYISPRAAYYQTPVGDNCFILEYNVIQPFVRIGNNVILWSANDIGHHVTIRDHCFISSHVVICGKCDIGENCFLGVNSTLKNNIRLDRFVVVNSGAIVMKDCAERTVVMAAKSTHLVINRDVI
jgi:sugar O-acyltransferase (sialic acid O-acetyltransferase NeuD family)